MTALYEALEQAVSCLRSEFEGQGGRIIGGMAEPIARMERALAAARGEAGRG